MIKEFIYGIDLNVILNFIQNNENFKRCDENTLHYIVFNCDLKIIPLNNKVLSKTVSIQQNKLIISGDALNVDEVYKLFFYNFLSAGA